MGWGEYESVLQSQIASEQVSEGQRGLRTQASEQGNEEANRRSIELASERGDRRKGGRTCPDGRAGGAIMRE